MDIRPFTLAAMIAASFVAMTLAVADRAGDPAYPPVVIVSSKPVADSVIVERGDHLWKISAAHLTDRLQRAARNQEISPYWRETIDVNKDRLRSGNPDLIFPGEEIRLPPIEQP